MEKTKDCQLKYIKGEEKVEVPRACLYFVVGAMAARQNLHEEVGYAEEDRHVCKRFSQAATAA